MTEVDLFTQPPRYPEVPGYKKRETSRRAAETVKAPGPNEQKVILALSQCDKTDHEIAAWLHMDITATRPRRSNLTARGVVIDSGKRRETPWGKQSIVWHLIGVTDG